MLKKKTTLTLIILLLSFGRHYLLEMLLSSRRVTRNIHPLDVIT
nr:hypothetical protein [Bacillus pumilus]